MITEIFGMVCTVIAVAGVWLNNRKVRACFVLWLFSNAISMALHIGAGLYSLAVRDLIFLALAVEGLIIWRESDKPFVCRACGATVAKRDGGVWRCVSCGRVSDALTKEIV